MVASAAAQAAGCRQRWWYAGTDCRTGLRNLFSGDGCANRHHAAAEGFCRHRMSGCTFSCSQANILPVRPYRFALHRGSSVRRTHRTASHGGEISRRRQNDATFALNRSRITAATSSPVFLHSLRAVRWLRYCQTAHDGTLAAAA